MKNELIVTFGERLGNFLAITGVMLVLLLAFLMQFIFNEPPCPLCLLQRFGFLSMAFGFLLNFRFGFRPSHYSIILLSGLFTMFVALRQIVLHVLPGTGSYGNAIFGLHLYTWSFILTTLVLISTSVLLGMDLQYLKKARENRLWRQVTHGLFVVLTFLIIANIVSIFLECGFATCPDNPAGYSWLKK